MTLLQSIILGIIQGLAEFLPISSSGHLILLERSMGLTEGYMPFNIAVHLGTLVSVLFIYWKDVWALIKNPFQKYVGLLIVATIPAIISAVLFNDFVEIVAGAPYLLALCFLVTGVALLFSDTIRNFRKTSKSITVVDALIIGIAQAIAIAPGISRSGATITTSITRGIKREDAARFSFLMSIVAITGAAVLEVAKSLKDPTVLSNISWSCTIAGFASAALVGFISVAFMIRVITKGKMRFFAYYVFAVAAFILFDYFVLAGSIFGK